MKLGCSGCLGTLLALALAALVVGGAIGAGRRMLATREPTTLPPTTAADGSRAQRKLFDLARRSRLPEPIVLTEAEVNALLTRHLVQARGVQLNALAVRLIGEDRVELTGQAPLGQLLDEAGVPVVAGILPSRWLRRPVWIQVGARARVDGNGRRQLRLDVENFAIGHQRLPAGMLRLVLDPAAVGLLRWPLPGSVESVTIEPGRVVIRSVSR